MALRKSRREQLGAVAAVCVRMGGFERRPDPIHVGASLRQRDPWL